jgi:SAM-dependent methyltransferase
MIPSDMPDRETRSRSFDQIAEDYDRYRPGYPGALVDYVISAGQVPPGGRIVEVGSGTGKATLPFAERGYAIWCIEPGANLAAGAQRKLRHYEQVHFVHARFEDWPLPGEASAPRFDLLISGQAFHWVPQEIGHRKAAQTVRPGGAVALFWNRQLPLAEPLESEIQAVYRRWYQPAVNNLQFSAERLMAEAEEEAAQMRATGSYAQVILQTFPWTARYTAGDYIGMLGTYSDHITRPAENRARLFAGIAQAIERNGGTLERHYVAVLYLGITKT